MDKSTKITGVQREAMGVRDSAASDASARSSADNMNAVERIDKNTAEIHNYTRLTFQLLVGWFTFFVTVNYASMGWIAKPGDPGGHDQTLNVLISGMFVSQNLLGIAACFICRKDFADRAKLVEGNEKLVRLIQAGTDHSSSPAQAMPLALFDSVCVLMALTFAIILLVWIRFVWILR